MISAIIHKIKLMVGMAILDAVKDSGEIQVLKISGLEDEVQDNVTRVQNYGLTSNPPVGSQAVVVYPGGDRSSGIAVAVDCGEFRIVGLASGEVCLYSQHGNSVLLNANGDVVINEGTNSAVAFQALNTAFASLVTQVGAMATVFNNHLPAPATLMVLPSVTIAGAEVPGVKL